MTAPPTAPATAAAGGSAAGDRRFRFRFNRNLIGGVVVLAAIAGWFVAYEATRRAQDIADRVAHLQELVWWIRGTAGAMYRAEAAHRDYLFTANEAQLQAYLAAATAVRTELAHLEDVADESTRPQLRSLEVSVAARLLLLDQVAARRESKGIEAALAPLIGAPGPTSALEIQSLFDRFEGRARARLAANEQISQSRQRTASLVLVGNGFFTVFIIFALTAMFNRDVRRQEEDEQRLRVALKAADAANAAKTQFLATISHEIRTPLNAVSGMSELLLETKLDTEQTEFVRAVHNNANALAMLIGDLLDQSKLDADQVFLDSAPFDVRELVEGVAELLVVRADVKGVELIVDLPPSGPRRLIGDRNRLRQVLMNLVGNAVKFTERGEIVIRGVLEPSADGSAARLRLKVIDTGIGIAQEARARIFERFVQAERTTARRYGGSGLGLHISRSLVELMGGTISLDSEPDRGSTFEVDITLPLAPAQPLPEFRTSSLAGVNLLLIQPNARLSEMIAHLLEFAGASVRSVATAEEGFAELAKASARVIVVGERLPDATGVEFARKMWHAHDRTSAPEASVVLIGSLRDTAGSFIGSYGISACLYKPVKQARLIQTVRVAAGLVVELQPQQLSAPTRAATRVVPFHILMAEDSRDNWALASHILTAAGYAVDRAEDGITAVASAAAFAYDLILMDIELPRIDGMEATRRIRAHDEAAGRRRVPIVALTAHAVESVRHEALSAGMDDYATKPFGKQTLIDTCRKWIDARARVLVVDDAPEIHVLVANYLRGTEYRLVDVFNGRDAIDAFATQRISLVLVDSNMAGMDGHETVRAIRRMRGGDGVPIIALTGDDTEQQRRFAAEWCDASLVKPVQRAELLATVASHIGVPASRRRVPRGAPESELPPGRRERRGTVTRLPTARDAASQMHRLLALRDFEGLAAFAESVRATANAQEMEKLANVSQELADAARTEDIARSQWWGDQIAPAVHEAQRLLDARKGGIDRRSYYDSIAHIATIVLHGHSAVLTLVRDQHVRIKGGANLPAHLDTMRDLPLTRSLTRFVVGLGRPLVVEDVREDARVQDASTITAHEIVSFVAVPLRNAGGVSVGAFGVMDRRPHRWPAEEVAALEELAGVAMRMLELEDTIETPSSVDRSTGPASPVTDSAPPAARAVDAVENAAEIIVDDDMADLLPGYVAAQRQIVETLRERLRQRDFTAIGQQGHRMKGSGAGYGLADVSRVGGELETAAAGGDSDAIEQLLGDLQRYLSRLVVRSADGRTVAQP